MLALCPACETQFDVGPATSGEHVRCPCGGVMEVPHAAEAHARTLHCTSCGAGVAQGSKDCTYCESEIHDEARRLGDPCPSCFVPVVMERDFCPGCGKHIDPVVLEAEVSDLSCPRCRSLMRYRPQSGGGSFHECAKCDGLWLSVRSFRVVLDTQEKPLPPVPTVERVRAGAIPAPIPDLLLQSEVRERAKVNLAAYAPCPTCTKMMNRQNFARCSGIVIDWCKDHGYWFDGGELEQIVSFVVDGGLETARDKDEVRRRQRQQIAKMSERLGSKTDRHIERHPEGPAGRRDTSAVPAASGSSRAPARPRAVGVRAAGIGPARAPEPVGGFFETLGEILGGVFSGR